MVIFPDPFMKYQFCILISVIYPIFDIYWSIVKTNPKVKNINKSKDLTSFTNPCIRSFNNLHTTSHKTVLFPVV